MIPVVDEQGRETMYYLWDHVEVEVRPATKNRPAIKKTGQIVYIKHGRSVTVRFGWIENPYYVTRIKGKIGSGQPVPPLADLIPGTIPEGSYPATSFGELCVGDRVVCTAKTSPDFRDAGVIVFIENDNKIRVELDKGTLATKQKVGLERL